MRTGELGVELGRGFFRYRCDADDSLGEVPDSRLDLVDRTQITNRPN